MGHFIFSSSFDSPVLDPALAWFCPPKHWGIQPGTGTLMIEPDARTDFWQRTHYGFRADNGHFLFTRVAGDFVMTARVRFLPVHQYDQAGLMVRLSADCWLKTSVEYEPKGPGRLGVVVTNEGYSDWSTQDWPAEVREILLRVRREGADYRVEWSTGGKNWSQLRMAHLREDDGFSPVDCGVYACSPKGAGFVAEFTFLTIESGRVVE